MNWADLISTSVTYQWIGYISCFFFISVEVCWHVTWRILWRRNISFSIRSIWPHCWWLYQSKHWQFQRDLCWAQANRFSFSLSSLLSFDLQSKCERVDPALRENHRHDCATFVSIDYSRCWLRTLQCDSFQKGAAYFLP